MIIIRLLVDYCQHYFYIIQKKAATRGRVTQIIYSIVFYGVVFLPALRSVPPRQNREKHNH